MSGTAVRLDALPAPGFLRGVGLVIERSLVWYRANWRSTVVASFLQPLLFLVAFGVGFGSLLQAGPQGAAVTGGLPYLVWLAPALLAMSAVQAGGFESTYPVLSGFKWQRIYHAMAATPLSGAQIALGQIGWFAAKMTLTGSVFVLVVAVFGGVVSVGVLGALAVAVLAGAAFGSVVMSFSATREDEGSAFSLIFRFVVLPMTLFSGTFFPIDRLPGWVQPLAWASPLWHATELGRALALDRIGAMAPSMAAAHLGYLLALLGLGTTLSVRHFTRRLTR